MARKYIDCRDYPSEMSCSVAIMADDEDELLQAAVEHAKHVHGHEDSPGLRDQLRRAIKNGAPAMEMPRHAAFLKD